MQYETEEMKQQQAIYFKLWFDEAIGTDYDENESEGWTYFLIMDLTRDELNKCKRKQVDMGLISLAA